MSQPRVWRSPAGSLRVALVQLAASAVVLGGVDIALAVSAAPPGLLWAHVLFVVVGWVYVGAGVLAWWRRPGNRMGVLITAGGFALLVAGLGSSEVPVLIALSTVLATVSLAVLVHLLHAFPSGRLRSPVSRATVFAGYAVCLVLQAPLYLFTVQPSPYDLLAVADRPDLAAAGAVVQKVAGAAVMVVTTVVLADRLRRADPPRRRVLAPLFAYGIFAVLFIPLSANVLAPLLGLPPDVLSGLQLLNLAGVPVAFTLAVLRGGFARTAGSEELGAWLGATDAGRPALVEALARALGDDSLQLVFWVPDRGEYVDAVGTRTELPIAGSERAAVEVDLAGRRVGAVVYDAGLIADPEVVRVAGQVVAIAVDRERLTAELWASQQALRLSRTRIVEAGDRERRRITRNLHDGLQVRLVLLAMEAQQVAEECDTPPAAQEAATALRIGIDAAAAELRQLVHAVLPAALIERGLAAATEDLVDRMPVPTRLELAVTDRALPAVVESTAYFVVAEGLANALKHAEARALAVRLTHGDAQLVVEVSDDGVGGASPEGGSGLRGLADRVDTLGGRLHVRSPTGQGTQLVAELPCGS